MVIDIEQQTYEMIPIEKIVSKLLVRVLSEIGIARIQESMRWSGFLENFPILVRRLANGTFEVVDGGHRYEAAKREGITYIPCIIIADLSEAEYYKLAMQSNNAAEAVVPSTMVTYAEFIWARLAEKKYTQSAIGEMLGWSRESVKDYAALQKIDRAAWDILGATFEKVAPSGENDVAPFNGAVAPFTERLLRPILDLSSEQQLELVTEFATKKDFSKSKFKTLAENYQHRNEAYIYALQKLGALAEDTKADQIKGMFEDSHDKLAKEALGEDSATQLKEAVYSGSYDADWEQKDHPKLHKLIASIREKWERKNNIRLIHGDFYEEVKKIADGSIDLVLTDPPYNIARENEFEYEGRANVSQDFGEWDKQKHYFYTWGQEWARILREQGSGYVFTQDSYISSLREALEEAGLHVKATIIWHKTNPGTQPVKTNFKSSLEYILFFTKGKGGHTFNWLGENEMHNFINAPICGGNERLVDAKGSTLHPTQKPEQVIQHFLEISSNRGDTVFDGFMGVGTTSKVAKGKGRKFIGIEQDRVFFEYTQRRLE